MSLDVQSSERKSDVPRTMLKLCSMIPALAVLATMAHALPRSETPTSKATRSAHPPPLRPRQVVGDDSFDVLQRECPGLSWPIVAHLSTVDLSGNSPYFNSPGIGLTAAVPVGCSVIHATYIVRHADIYGNDVSILPLSSSA